MYSYLHILTQDAIEIWNQFWFRPTANRRMGITRLAIGLVAIVYVALWWNSLGQWIQSGSILDRPTMQTLALANQFDPAVAPRQFRPSLLFFFDTPASTTTYLVVTMIAAVLTTAGIGGRWSSAALFILILGIVHRVHYLTGPAEYLLTAMLGYLAIHSGKEANLLRMGIQQEQGSILENIAQRLLQVHQYGWLLLCFFSHQAGLIWWQGEASWWLAASGRSALFGMEELYRQPWIVNGLTHTTVAMLLAALLTLPFRRTRPLGWLATILYWCLVVIISNEVLYASIGIAGSLCWFTTWHQALESPCRALETAYPATRAS